MIMVIKSRHIYRLLILSLAGILLLSLFWEFYLEDLVVPYIYVYYHPEPTYERLEYVFVSVIAAAIALIVPGWIAIHSTRQTEKAMEALGKAHDELDQRVQQRTAELENSNRELVSALERQRDTEEALRSSVADLKLLSSRLLVLQEDEKKFLASELHESLSQTLSALKFRFEHILSHGQVGNEEMTADIQHKVLPTIQGAIDDVRNIYMDLRPTLLDDLGSDCDAQLAERRIPEKKSSYPCRIRYRSGRKRHTRTPQDRHLQGGAGSTQKHCATQPGARGALLAQQGERHPGTGR